MRRKQKRQRRAFARRFAYVYRFQCLWNLDNCCGLVALKLPRWGRDLHRTTGLIVGAESAIDCKSSPTTPRCEPSDGSRKGDGRYRNETAVKHATSDFTEFHVIQVLIHNEIFNLNPRHRHPPVSLAVGQ